MEHQELAGLRGPQRPGQRAGSWSGRRWPLPLMPSRLPQPLTVRPAAPVVGMVGAGQLARMTAAAAVGLGIRFRVLAAAPDESAAQVCADTVLGDYRSTDDLLAFAAGCDVVTFDHEHVPQPQLDGAGAGRARGPAGRRSPALHPGQAGHARAADRARRAVPAVRAGVSRSPTSTAFADADGLAGRAQGGLRRLRRPRRLGLREPRRGGGRARRTDWRCSPRSTSRSSASWRSWSPARRAATAPPTRSCRPCSGTASAVEVLAPGPAAARGHGVEAQRLGPRTRPRPGCHRAAGGGAVRDPARRPAGERARHAAAQQRPLDDRGRRTSQFEQHLRAVLNLPLGSPMMTAPCGGDGERARRRRSRSARQAEPRDGGRHGAEGAALRQAGPARPQGRPCDGAWRRLGRVRDRAVRAAQYLATGAEPSEDRDHGLRRQRHEGECGHERRPVVGVVMGSDSDWPVMQAAVEVLDEFGVPSEADVVSAHRMPTDMISYGQAAAGRGVKVIIAGAGGAAHLPGMLASVTPLPVIGVPVPLKHLDGLDSLLSIVQMPAGIPVATVAVGGARNAGLLAVRILAVSDPELAGRMAAFQADLRSGRPGEGRGPAREGPGPARRSPAAPADWHQRRALAPSAFHCRPRPAVRAPPSAPRRPRRSRRRARPPSAPRRPPPRTVARLPPPPPGRPPPRASAAAFRAISSALVDFASGR